MTEVVGGRKEVGEGNVKESNRKTVKMVFVNGTYVV